MNVFELAFAIGVVAAIVFGSRFLGHNFGASPWVIGVVLSAVAALLLWFLHRGAKRNLFPECENRRCGPDDYKGIGADPRGLLFECGCGRRYLLSRGRFRALDQVGNPRPYKRKIFLGGWIDDT